MGNHRSEKTVIRRLVLGLMGAAGSKLEKALGDQFPEGERYFGFENFGNTCYCNSVLQVPLPLSNLSPACDSLCIELNVRDSIFPWIGDVYTHILDDSMIWGKVLLLYTNFESFRDHFVYLLYCNFDLSLCAMCCMWMCSSSTRESLCLINFIVDL